MSIISGQSPAGRLRSVSLISISLIAIVHTANTANWNSSGKMLDTIRFYPFATCNMPIVSIGEFLVLTSSLEEQPLSKSSSRDFLLENVTLPERE